MTLRPRRWTSPWWLLLAAAIAAAGSDCDGRSPATPAPAAPRAVVASNIHREDYAGSAACAKCHAAEHAKWLDSPMHRMTRSLPTEVRAPFDGATLKVGADVATMEREGDASFVRVTTAREGERRFRVTRVIGGRYREDFAGVEVGKAGGLELVLPVSYVYSTRSWRYKGYSVLVPDRPGIYVGPVWSQTCIGCHNTFPYFDMLLDDLAGAEAGSYQGSISDDLLPPGRAFVARATSESALSRALAEELGYVRGAEVQLGEMKVSDALSRSIRTIEQELDGRHLVEEGVGCEACHGGAAAHARDPSVLPTYSVVSPAIAVQSDDDTPFTGAQAKNRVCARCHTVLFSDYPWTWEGGRRDGKHPGGSSINSGEARDFLLGGCATELTCTHCHDPHAEDDKAALARFDRPEGNGICTSCHGDLASPAALNAHSHHDPAGEGAACLACHMPRKNMGLDYGLTRYHRIGSPTDPERVYGDRPLECAICHAATSSGELLSKMSQWWGKDLDRDRVAALYGGDLSTSNLRATLAQGKPHEQAVAIVGLAQTKDRSLACTVAAEVAQPYPLVRHLAKHALETLMGAEVALDPDRAASELGPEVERWCEASR